jgi:hypothetical protein
MANNPRNQMFETPAGGKRIADPIKLDLSFPGNFVPGSSSGGVTASDAYTITVTMSPPLQLPPECELHLLSASISYSFPNLGVTADGIPNYPAGNSRVSINFNAGGRTDFVAPTGLYAYQDVASWLNQVAVAQGWISSTATPLFAFTGIAATQKLILTVNPAGLAGGAFPAGGIVIDFLNPSVAALNNSIGPVLGWPTSGGGATLTIAAGTAPVQFFAPNVADFAFVSAYVAYLSCLRDGSFNGGSGKVLYVFPLGAGRPNTVVAYQPPLAAATPVVSGSYSQLSLYFTDQAGNRLKTAFFQAPTQLSMIIGKTKIDGSL